MSRLPTLAALAALAFLALACGRDPKREAELRSKAVGRWVYADTERPGQREELDLSEDGSRGSRLFPPGATEPVTQRGKWSVNGDDLMFDGCSGSNGAHRPKFEGGKMIFVGNEGSFPYERRP